MIVAAKNVPQTVDALLHFYVGSRHPGEAFRAWLLRTPEKQIIAQLKPHAELAENSEENFIDWGDTETYSLQLGRGECAS
jgi:sulfite reductase (NADPH) hemoprotein beta-component/sulfite reductase (ferredoxin)